MTMAVADSPPVPQWCELAAMFAGVPDEHGGWDTTPCYAVGLAVAICRQFQPGNVTALRETVYDVTPAEQVPDDALQALQLGFQRYQYLRRIRGL